MPRPLWPLFALGIAAKTVSAFDQFYFATEASSWQCQDDFGYLCIAPQICAHEGLLNKTYCCGVGSNEALCWTGSTECGSNNQPLTGQIGCDTGSNAFCCLDTRETCTQRTNQVNICWSTGLDPLQNVTFERSNATFSSLNAAAPSATTLSINTAVLLATSTATSAVSSAASTSAALVHAATTSASSSSGSSGLSGGAIAGIVVGVVLGLALIAAGAILYWLRAKREGPGGNEMDSSNAYTGAYAPVSVAQEKYAQQGVQHQAQYHYPPAEMDNAAPPVEAPGSEVGMVAKGAGVGR